MDSVVVKIENLSEEISSNFLQQNGLVINVSNEMKFESPGESFAFPVPLLKGIHEGEKHDFVRNKVQEERPCSVASVFKEMESNSDPRKTNQGTNDFNKDKVFLKCDLCVRTFSCSALLNLHKRLHGVDAKAHNRKAYKCDVCMKTFSQHSHLKVHMRIHSEKPPFQCGICHKAFHLQRELNNHERTHFDQELHRCNICKWTFSHRGFLKIHMRIHSEKPPFLQCSICHKAFRLKHKLNNHERTHFDQELHRCNV